MRTWTLILLGTYATAAVAQVVLTENLEHPPRLESCMKKIFPFPVKRFVGPILADDRLYVDYAAVGSDGVRYKWRFRPAIGAAWRPFLYQGPEGTAVGVSTKAMIPISEVVPEERWRMPIAVDTNPCETHFRK